MQRRIFSIVLTLALIACAGCVDFGANRTVGINSTGTVVGLAFLDRNANGVFETAIDAVVPGVAIRVIPAGALNPTVRVVTAPNGVFGAPDLPVGDYRLVVDPTTVPDSIRLIEVTTPTVRVAAGDSVGVLVVLSYPIAKVRDARTLPLGKRIFIEGVTLNAWSTYGDSTLHVSDSTGVIRATRVAPSNVTSGQRVRVLGTTDVRDGLPTLTDATVFQLASATPPSPIILSTANAARASNGTLDAALVQISTATILGGIGTPSGDFLVTINDGSGLLEVLIDRSTGITLTQLIPGALLNVTGLLVPSGRVNEWQLKPRSNADMAVSFQTATVAQARQQPVGKLVSVDATALNSWVTFGDSTVHITDGTGFIRTVRTQAVTIFPGDRIRVLGVVAFRDGQPVLTSATVSVLGSGTLPLAEATTTLLASKADNGRLDAAQVKVTNATVADTATVNGDFVMHVNDGSGLLEVLLDRDSGFQLAPFIPGAVLNVTGVLVPLPTGRDWRLKPRFPTQQGTVPPDVVIVR